MSVPLATSPEWDKMAARKANGDHGGVRINGFDDIPRPFLIGVGGGTASGKVGLSSNFWSHFIG